VQLKIAGRHSDVGGHFDFVIFLAIILLTPSNLYSRVCSGARAGQTPKLPQHLPELSQFLMFRWLKVASNSSLSGLKLHRFTSDLYFNKIFTLLNSSYFQITRKYFRTSAPTCVPCQS